MENKNNMLPDEMLAQVSGGGATGGLPKVTEWGQACDHYECKLCGMHGIYFSNHKDGCAVRNFPYSGNNGMATELGKNLNFCWSCKHVVHGNNYPADRSDLYCGRG